MGPGTSWLFLLFGNIVIPIAILIFATGFFPYKPFLPGIARFGDVDNRRPLAAPFDKVIFMVVDALRSDFVYSQGSGFSFTQQLISAGAAIPFTAHAASPTITMPRVKAMTTGSIPSFLDVILNFAESDTTSTLAHQDTWLAQMKARDNGDLIMYGDDTWLKLFPDTFKRADGTSSFFVSDFTEVDHNVTRHVPNELQNGDWNTMIMHYLGLDHIGHKAGPRSPNMIPKQQEMDEIVQKIYKSIEREAHLASTLLVLSGDHGMNDAGNHGGSAPGETSPGLVFISPKMKEISSGVACPAKDANDFQYYKSVEQSDIVPTLAGLLGFPVPQNNLGVFISEFLPFWKTGNEKEQLLLENAQQIVEIINATFPSPLWEHRVASTECKASILSDVDELACKWRESMVLLSGERADVVAEESQKVLDSLDTWSKRAQEIMSSTASNYDVSRLISGMALMGVAVITAALLCFSLLKMHIATGLCFVTLTISYGGMMFASSYVEEEQHFWYWTTSGWFAFLAFQEVRLGDIRKVKPGVLSTLLLATLRVTRRWNQTGQKFAGEPDISKSFSSNHNFVLWILVAATYIDIFRRLSLRNLRRVHVEVATMTAMALCLAAAGFKAAFTFADAPELFRDLPQPILNGLASAPLISQARTVFVGIALVLGYVVLFELRQQAQMKDSTEEEGGISSTSTPAWIFHDLVTLLLVTQSRITNIPLFLIFELQLAVLLRLDLSLPEISMTSILLQHASFFAFGGSNAISSIDLSNAYNGVSGYNVIAVGVLTFVSNWAGPMWWTSATTFLLLAKKQHQHQHQQRDSTSKSTDGKGTSQPLFGHLALLSLFVTTSLLFVMAACTALRSHLFIWTVFSPKYLYSMAWSIGQHLCVNGLLGGLLFWAGRVDS